MDSDLTAERDRHFQLVAARVWIAGAAAFVLSACASEQNWPEPIPLAEEAYAQNNWQCMERPRDGGKRPLCAHPDYYDDRCWIGHLRADTCACHEFQTRSCVVSAASDISRSCKIGTNNCGFRTCNVADDYHSTWSTTCTPVP